MRIQPDTMLIAQVVHDALMRLQADKSVKADLTEPLEQIRSAIRVCNFHRQGPSEPPTEEAKP